MAFNWNSLLGGGTSTPSTAGASSGSSLLSAGALFQTPTPSTTTTTAPATNVANPEFSTQYADLNSQWKGELHKILEYIESEKSKSQELSERSPDLISKVKEETSVLGEKLNTLTNSLERDRQTIARLRTDVSRELQYAELAARTIERMGTSGGMMHLHQQFTLPSKYFLEVSASFDERMKQYFLAINEIEQYLSASSTRRPYSPQTLGEIMRNQHELFMAIASQAAAIHDMVQQQKEKFVAYRNEVLGTADVVDDVFEKEKPKRAEAAKVRYVPLPNAEQQKRAAAAAGTQPATTPTTSLWGTPTTTTTTTTPGTTGGFNLGGWGTTPTTTTTTPAGSNSLFGGSLFGGTTTPSVTAGLGMSTAGANLTFGATPTGGLFGGSTTTPSRPATGKTARKKGP